MARMASNQAEPASSHWRHIPSGAFSAGPAERSIASPAATTLTTDSRALESSRIKPMCVAAATTGSYGRGPSRASKEVPFEVLVTLRIIVRAG
jgi:hypothetical protein